MKCKIKIEGISPLLFSKTTGDISKKDALSDDDTAEAGCYRHKNGELAMPTANIKASIRYGYSYGYANWKDKDMNFGQDVSIEPVDSSDPMNVSTGQKKYEIFKRPVLIGRDKRGSFAAAGTAVNAQVDDWTLEFIITSALTDVTIESLKEIIEKAGFRGGIGGFRKGGYGRYKIVNFEVLES